MVEPFGLPRLAGDAFALGGDALAFGLGAVFALVFLSNAFDNLFGEPAGLPPIYRLALLAASLTIFDAIFLAILLPLNNIFVLWVLAHRPLRLTLI